MPLSRIVLFLLIVGLILGSVHYYVWTRLVRGPRWPSPWPTVLTAFFAIAFVSIFVGFLSQKQSRTIAGPIAWVSFSWLGLLFFLFLSTLVSDSARAVLAFIYRADEYRSTDPQRRIFIARAFAGLIAGVSGVSGALAFRQGIARPQLKTVSIRLANVPSGKGGKPYRVVQITDVHVGPTIGRAFVEDMVERVNALAPDLIAITGDLVDGTVAELREHVAPLGKLRAREGVFFVTGNHEYYSGADAWIAHLESMGIIVLRNERRELPSGVIVAGVDDASARRSHASHGANFETALAGIGRERFVLFLAHQPKAILEATKFAVSLQLSGHTHGGQIFPFNFFVKLQQPYTVGLFDHEKTKLYVSPGTGYWGPPMRLGTRSEITLLELTAA